MTETSNPTEEVEHRPRNLWVAATVIFTMTITFAMVALIYWRWFSWAEPSSILVVDGGPGSAGVVVEAIRLRVDDGVTGAVAVELNEGNAYVARFFLEPGPYQVSAMRGGEVRWRESFRMQDNRQSGISLARLFPATMPTPDAGPTR